MNALRLDRQTRLFCGPRRWRALRMVQARQGHSISPASPQPFKRFNKLGSEQTFKSFLHYELGHAHREPYLCRVGYILTRHCRQNAFLLARQKARLVAGTHHQPEGVLRIGDAQISTCMQLDNKLMNPLRREPQFLCDLFPNTASAADVSIKSSFASIATVVFEYLPCRSGMRQAACERVRATFGALAGMVRPLLTDSGLPHYGITHSHPIRGGDAVHNSNGA
jgi:hypothetical protein